MLTTAPGLWFAAFSSQVRMRIFKAFFIVFFVALVRLSQAALLPPVDEWSTYLNTDPKKLLKDYFLKSEDNTPKKFYRDLPFFFENPVLNQAASQYFNRSSWNYRPFDLEDYFENEKVKEIIETTRIFTYSPEFLNASFLYSSAYELLSNLLEEEYFKYTLYMDDSNKKQFWYLARYTILTIDQLVVSHFSLLLLLASNCKDIDALQWCIAVSQQTGTVAAFELKELDRRMSAADSSKGSELFSDEFRTVFTLFMEKMNQKCEEFLGKVNERIEKANYSYRLDCLGSVNGKVWSTLVRNAAFSRSEIAQRCVRKSECAGKLKEIEKIELDRIHDTIESYRIERTEESLQTYRLMLEGRKVKFNRGKITQ